MQSFNENDIVSYLKGLEVEELKASYPVAKSGVEVAEGIEQSFINAKTLVSFVSEISGQNRNDVLNSVLLAQLAANKKFPDESQTLEWYKSFVKVLNNLGWNIEASEFSTYETNHSLIEVENAVIEILIGAFGANLQSILTSTLKAIKQLSDSNGKITAFEKNTHSLSKGAFQIGLAKEENGAVSLQLGTFLLTTSNEIKKILFFKSTKDKTKLEYNSQKGTLNEEVYSKGRQAVVDKLGFRLNEFITEIEI